MLLLDVKIREELLLLVCAHDNAVDLVIVHVTHLLVLFFLVGFQDRALRSYNMSFACPRADTTTTTNQELLLLFLRRLVVESTGLNDLVVDVELVARARIHGLLHALLRDEAQDAHGLGLADTMRTILRLQISMWIPKTKPSVYANADKRKGPTSRSRR